MSGIGNNNVCRLLLKKYEWQSMMPSEDAEGRSDEYYFWSCRVVNEYAVYDILISRISTIFTFFFCKVYLLAAAIFSGLLDYRHQPGCT